MWPVYRQNDQTPPHLHPNPPKIISSSAYEIAALSKISALRIIITFKRHIHVTMASKITMISEDWESKHVRIKVSVTTGRKATRQFWFFTMFLYGCCRAASVRENTFLQNSQATKSSNLTFTAFWLYLPGPDAKAPHLFCKGVIVTYSCS